MKFGRIVIAVLLVGCHQVTKAGDAGQSIDRTLSRTADVTGDGQPDTISLHLRAESMAKPFKWTLTITSGEMTLLTYDSDDAWLDRNFNDQGFVDNCKDYLSCKEQYYFRDILDTVLSGESSYDVEGILNRSAPNTLFPIGRAFLKECCNITASRADQILGLVETRIRGGKTVLICIPLSPVQLRDPMVYVQEVKQFVPVYRD